MSDPVWEAELRAKIERIQALLASGNPDAIRAAAAEAATLCIEYPGIPELQRLYEQALSQVTEAQKQESSGETDIGSTYPRTGGGSLSEQQIRSAIEAVTRLFGASSVDWSKVPSGVFPPSSQFETEQQARQLSDDNLTIVRQGLEAVRSHVMETNFLERAKKPTGTGKVKTTNDKDISALEVAHLEPLPTPSAPAPIAIVEVLDKEGKVIGRLRTVSVSGYSNRWDIPTNPPTRLRLTRQDRSSFEWTSGTTPPPGYRLGITPTKAMKRSGFYGGHTRNTWNETLATYGDIIRVTKQDKLGFKIPGQIDLIEVSIIKYQVRGEKTSTSGYNWKDVQNPKSIFEGSGNTSINALEEFMAPFVAQKLEIVPLGDRTITVEVPVITLSSKQTNFNIRVAREPDPTGATIGKIESWWVEENNLTNPALVVP